MNLAKNRNREPYSFANINLLGRCNAHCFFCLGDDIKEELGKFYHHLVPVNELPNLDEFLKLCQKNKIEKMYITGQNTDSLLYNELPLLIEYLHVHGFKVGLRTNGYEALERMHAINMCELSTGYSIHSLCPMTNKMIMNRNDIPDWNKILRLTKRPRVQIVVNRCNRHEFWDILKFLANPLYKHVRYIQARRVSTDTRVQQLAPDIDAYETLYTEVSRIFPLKKRLWEDAEVYNIYGRDVVFWRTVKTSVNSMNYFSDGTISPEYFVVEGYLKNKAKPCAEIRS